MNEPTVLTYHSTTAPVSCEIALDTLRATAITMHQLDTHDVVVNTVVLELNPNSLTAVLLGASPWMLEIIGYDDIESLAYLLDTHNDVSAARKHLNTMLTSQHRQNQVHETALRALRRGMESSAMTADVVAHAPQSPMVTAYAPGYQLYLVSTEEKDRATLQICRNVTCLPEHEAGVQVRHDHLMCTLDWPLLGRDADARMVKSLATMPAVIEKLILLARHGAPEQIRDAVDAIQRNLDPRAVATREWAARRARTTH